MKKLLLFSLAIGLTFGSFAQKKVAKSNDELKKNLTEERTDFSLNKHTSEFTPNNVELKNGNAAMFDRIPLGMSGNVYSVLTSYQRSMAYDAASGTYLGTFRADPASYDGAHTSGTMMAHFSSDGGVSWDHIITLNPEAGSEWALRYPSGVIFNPEASSNADDVYSVQAGPSHDNGTWDKTFHAVSQSTGDNQSNFYYIWESENDWARSSMTTVGDAVYNFGQDYESIASMGLNQTMKQHVGTTDDATDGFDWEYNDVLPDWESNDDGSSSALYTTWSAWSKDGSIGYMWMVGVTDDSREYGDYQPAVFYTEDGGDSWDDIEVNLEDNEVLAEYLPYAEDAGGNPTVLHPVFLTGDRTYPGVVDYNGDLHLVSNVFGASKADPLDPENGYWIVGDNAGGHIFDFVINVDGVQNVVFIDSLTSVETDATAFGDVGWDHRIQVSKSVDETKIFVVWAEDRDAETVISPDIYTWAYDAEAGYVFGEAFNATEDDLYAGYYFFHYVAEYTPLIGDFYEIPISTSISPEEFNIGDPLLPVTHTFIKGIGYLTDGVEEGLVSQEGSISVSQNMPNPFNGSTKISVSTQTAADVTVEVSNIMGQTIYTLNAGTINGTQEIVLPAENLEAGIYFYTVRVGNESISKKMMVE